jgi:hypothetical protein
MIDNILASFLRPSLDIVTPDIRRDIDVTAVAALTAGNFYLLAHRPHYTPGG